MPIEGISFGEAKICLLEVTVLHFRVFYVVSNPSDSQDKMLRKKLATRLGFSFKSSSQ